MVGRPCDTERVRTRSTAVRARQLLEDGQSAIEAGDHAGSIPILEQAAQLGRLLLGGDRPGRLGRVPQPTGAARSTAD